MERKDFEAMTLAEVSGRADAEGPPEHGKPKHYDRPWTQLRDEMVAGGAATIDDLTSTRVDLFYNLTRSD